MSKEIDEKIATLLTTVANHFNDEDRATRERQIRHWHRLKLYWNNLSNIYWDEKARDYRLLGQDDLDSTNQTYYDRPVNVFKAFLETIIAALSIQIPAIACVPDDADNPLDNSTAKAGDKIAELIYKHNDVAFVWLQGLYVYCTEGMVACYTHPKEHKDYGTYEKPKIKDEEVQMYVCPNCNAPLEDDVFSEMEMNEFAPDDDDAKLHSEIEEHGPVCYECGVRLDPALEKTKLIVPRIVGYTTAPKSRVCLDVRGGLYVKVANYTKDQAGTPYLIYSEDTHYSNVLEEYPNLKENMPQGGWSNIGINDPYEQYGRLNTQYRGEYPLENVTVKKCWLRPAAFNILPDEDCKRLKKKFPDGAKLVLCNTIVAEYCNESLDDNWTLTQNPVSDYLTHEPLGELLTNIQDIVNDLISLTLQTIEHGIEQTWADPAVVNFNAQKQIEAMPGTLTPTKQTDGRKSIKDAFYSTKTAALSPEVIQFYKIIQELGQFVSGALPSLFGGNQGGSSSGTASEYAMSKGMAMQRLQTPWRMMTIWWKKIFGKSIPLYMKIMVEDEKIVQRTKQGGFVNVFIRKAELDGKIGDIELEPDDKMPISDEQQADMIMQLFTLNNTEISQALLDPDNIPFIRKVVKIPQFKLPGEEDRQKQYEEITELLNSEPILLPPSPEDVILAEQQGTQPQPIERSSVDIDLDIDNHQIEASICKSWLISGAGRLAKIENEKGYKNVLLHMKAHQDQVAIMMQQQRMQQVEDQLITNTKTNKNETTSVKVPAAKPKQTEKIDGENDVRQPIG